MGLRKFTLSSDGRSTRWDKRREEVSDAVDQIYLEGGMPTIRGVIERVGGSPNFISPIIKDWYGRMGLERVRRGHEKGSTPWNKGLTKDDDPRLAAPGRGKNFLRDGKPWNAGKCLYNDERLKNLSDKMKGRALSPEHRKSLLGYKPGRFIGEKHWKWSGGKSKRYWRGSDWASVKERILLRDGCCVRCGKLFDTWAVGGVVRRRKLSVHHFDPWHETHNNSVENLVTVCVACHMVVEADQNENQKLKDQVYQKYGYS